MKPKSATEFGNKGMLLFHFEEQCLLGDFLYLAW